jgi:5,10-methylene-tetrahydrofolate dehydrogenase/methenyl tetrahydrofolate cyclohydrolase
MKRQLIFDGFLYQSTLLSTLKQQTNTLSSTPTLAIINLNQSIISDRYIARKRQAVHSAGMQLIQLVSTSNHLGPLIDDLNHSKDIHGVIL